MNDTEQSLFTDTLTESAAGLKISLSAAQVAQCLQFADLLLETNRHTNLTRITAPDAMAIKHFADSLTVFRVAANLSIGARVVDVGTGAGFPGVVLKIVRPDLRLTLLDSLNKRLIFLQLVANELGFDDITLLHARAEEAGRLPAHRDSYDLVTARAVAALPILLEWCAPLALVGGGVVAMKTDTVDTELTTAASLLPLLRVRLERDLTLTLPPVRSETASEPASQNRRILLFRKTAPTPSRYPRRPSEIP